MLVTLTTAGKRPNRTHLLELICAKLASFHQPSQYSAVSLFHVYFIVNTLCSFSAFICPCAADNNPQKSDVIHASKTPFSVRCCAFHLRYGSSPGFPPRQLALPAASSISLIVLIKGFIVIIESFNMLYVRFTVALTEKKRVQVEAVEFHDDRHKDPVDSAPLKNLGYSSLGDDYLCPCTMHLLLDKARCCQTH